MEWVVLEELLIFQCFFCFLAPSLLLLVCVSVYLSLYISVSLSLHLSLSFSRKAMTLRSGFKHPLAHGRLSRPAKPLGNQHAAYQK